MTSQARQNYHQECEAGVNKQVNLKLRASYVFHSMSMHFERDDVALPGFASFYKKLSNEEREHAEQLMGFQNRRGGRIVFQDIQKPSRDDWGSPLETLQASLELQKTVNQSLLDLHSTAANHKDDHFCNFIEETYLNRQVESIKELSDMLTNQRRAGTGLGEYMVDKTIQEAEDSS